MTPDFLNTVWTVVVRAVLLGLLAAGLWRLYRTYLDSQRTHKKRTAHGYVALALTLFVAYDLCIYHRLVNDLPYTLTKVGAGRFILDLFMTFCIYLVLKWGMSAEVWSKGRKIMLTLAVWHLLAVTWHIMAHAERNKSPSWEKYTPHLIVSVVYIMGYAVSGYYLKQNKERGHRRFDQQLVLAFFTILIAFSLFRLWQMW